MTVRKPHAALNMLIQSAGAIVCKRWLLLVDAELRRRGLQPNEVDYDPLMFCHDELQYSARTMEIAEIIETVVEEIAVEAGRYYNLDCPMAGSGKIGRNWAETH